MSTRTDDDDDDTPIRTRLPSSTRNNLLALGGLAFVGLGAIAAATVVAVRYAKSSFAPATSNAGDPTPKPATPNVPFGTLPMRGGEPAASPGRR